MKEEAKQAGCPYLLLTTIKHVASGSTAGRIAGQAAYGAAGQAAYDYAVTVRNKDELTLGYRLETPDGTVLIEKREKRKAQQDGEDLLTPMVQNASEAIAAAVAE